MNVREFYQKIKKKNKFKLFLCQLTFSFLLNHQKIYVCKYNIASMYRLNNYGKGTGT